MNVHRVWKFGYGSNMSQEFLRKKKALKPLDSHRTILRGFALSFPEGRGIDFVEPSFATLKRDPSSAVHGVSTMLSVEDAEKLDNQESGYKIEVCSCLLYDGKTELDVEVYVPKTPLANDHPEGCCSKRYRSVLVKGAKENNLDENWIRKLENLPVYNPSVETLSMRAALPPPSALPTMTVAELKRHNGTKEGLPVLTSSCGYIFEHKPYFKSYYGRDVTYRHVLHARGINLDANDDGGVSPFPRLSKLAPDELEYVLQYRDRFIHKSRGAVAVLAEFWQEQEEESDGLFRDNSLSKLGDIELPASDRTS